MKTNPLGTHFTPGPKSCLVYSLSACECCAAKIQAPNAVNVNKGNVAETVAYLKSLGMSEGNHPEGTGTEKNGTFQEVCPSCA